MVVTPRAESFIDRTLDELSNLLPTVCRMVHVSRFAINQQPALIGGHGQLTHCVKTMFMVIGVRICDRYVACRQFLDLRIAHWLCEIHIRIPYAIFEGLVLVQCLWVKTLVWDPRVKHRVKVAVTGPRFTGRQTAISPRGELARQSRCLMIVSCARKEVTSKKDGLSKACKSQDELPSGFPVRIILQGFLHGMPGFN